MNTTIFARGKPNERYVIDSLTASSLLTNNIDSNVEVFAKRVDEEGNPVGDWVSLDRSKTWRRISTD